MTMTSDRAIREVRHGVVPGYQRYSEPASASIWSVTRRRPPTWSGCRHLFRTSRRSFLGAAVTVIWPLAQLQGSLRTSRYQRLPLTAMSSNSTPITLQSLQPYAAHQEELIEALLARDTQNFRFREPEEAWTPFWESVWGKDLKFEKEQVVRDPHPISDSLILPDVVPPHCVLLPKPKTLDDCWKGFQLKKIFIRDEFKEAEEFVLSIFGEAKMYYDAVTITGQPEIGLPLSYSAVLGS